MLSQGRVGTRPATTGIEMDIALGKDSQLLMSQFGGKYQELVRSGRVFSGGTAVTGVAPGTAIGTTAPFTLFNPSGSTKDLVVLRASMAYLSGTLGIGVVHYVANIVTAAAAVSGTAITAVNALLGSRIQPNGLAFTTATLPAAPTVLRPFVNLPPMLASTVLQPWQVLEDVDGEFVLAPGSALSLEGTAAAGTTPLVVYGMTWAEFDR